MDTPANDLELQKKEHLAYLKKCGPYEMDCSCEIFNNDQINLIRQFGHWFKALVEGVLEPYTQSQRNFIDVMKGDSDPVSFEEQTWFLYMKRKEYEKKFADRLKRRYSLDEDPFYNRRDVGKLRGGMMGTIHSTHSQGMQTKTFGRYNKK